QGQPLNASRNGQDLAVKVAFPSTLQKSQHYQVSLSYTGKLTGDQDSPVPGIKFAALHPDFGFLLYPARWFPVSGYTVNRFTADLHITTPSEYRVVASGDVKTDRAGNGGTIYSFHYEHASFPGSIAILKDDPLRVSSEGVNEQVFFRGDQAANARAYGEETGKIVSYLTSVYGLIPQASLT